VPPRALPIVASGGVGELNHFVDGAKAGATGLLAASASHYGDVPYCRSQGCACRCWLADLPRPSRAGGRIARRDQNEGQHPKKSVTIIVDTEDIMEFLVAVMGLLTVASEEV
jgi:hypothetical protein